MVTVRGGIVGCGSGRPFLDGARRGRGVGLAKTAGVRRGVVLLRGTGGSWLGRHDVDRAAGLVSIEDHLTGWGAEGIDDGWGIAWGALGVGWSRRSQVPLECNRC